MQQFLVLALLVAGAYAQYVHPGYGDPYAQPTPYSYGYEAPSIGGTHSHQESGDGYGRVEGRYEIHDADGRTRVVTYYADETGFHPTIETNELGTESGHAGTATYHSSAPTGPEAAAIYDGHRAARA